MIQVPKRLSEDTFDDLFVPGVLFLCENYQFGNGKLRDKYILILNPHDDQNNAYFYLTTSKVEKYRGNPLYKDSMFIFRKEDVAEFDKETAIIIPKVYSKDFRYFRVKYINLQPTDRLIFCRKIPDSILDDIYKMIMASNALSLKIKRLILPARYLGT